MGYLGYWIMYYTFRTMSMLPPIRSNTYIFGNALMVPLCSNHMSFCGGNDNSIPSYNRVEG